MINLNRIVHNSSWNQSFIAHRSSGHFGSGGWIEDSSTAIVMTGAVTNAEPQEEIHVPEGDRIMGSRVFVTDQILYQSRLEPGQGSTDEIEYKGERYHLHKIWDYADYGFWKAIGSRLAGV